MKFPFRLCLIQSGLEPLEVNQTEHEAGAFSDSARLSLRRPTHFVFYYSCDLFLFPFLFNLSRVVIPRARCLLYNSYPCKRSLIGVYIYTYLNQRQRRR